MIPEIEFPAPTKIGLLSNSEIVSGLPIPPIDRLRTFDANKFEDMIREWVVGYLMKNGEYIDCKKCSGAGDKGRDVIAKINQLKWVNFQCKFYSEALAPTDIYKELIKLIHYTFTEQFTIPEKYFFVSPHGAGPKLNGYLENPKELKENLYANWEGHAQIGKSTIVELSDELKSFIDEKIDFSIIGCIDPQLLIEQHRQTAYYSSRFGGGLTKRREIIKSAPEEIQNKEQVYTSELFKAYSDYKGSSITQVEHFEDDSRILNHFQRQRVGFYSADSLNQYSRDTLHPDCDYFEDLKDQFYMAIIDTNQNDYNDAFVRVRETISYAQTINITGSPLVTHLRSEDRIGICHHLVNDLKIKWVY